MSGTFTFFFRHTLGELEGVLLDHQERFETLLKDSFTDEELQVHERSLDQIAAVSVQPILEELTFDDFVSPESQAVRLRSFFDACRSTLCFEFMPYLQDNPFQVSYFLILLERFDQCLVDRGGLYELIMREEFLRELGEFRTLDDLLPAIPATRSVPPSSSAPVHPVDFLLQDVYRELRRLEDLGKAPGPPELLDQPEKFQRLHAALSGERLDAVSLLKKSSLHPKEFEDNLERMKFWLRKIT